MDLRAIEIFLAVCDTGGLTSAARRLGITQAAVSQRIKQLEKELGLPLLNRLEKPPRLFPAGVLLRDRGRRLLYEAEDLQRTLERYRGVEIPELRIGFIESVGPTLFPRLVPELRRMVGTLSITSGFVGMLLPDLIRGELDIAITSEQPDELHGIQRRTLLREPFVLVLPKGVETPARPEDFLRLSQKLTFLRFERRRRLSKIVDRQFQRHDIELPRTLEFVSATPILDMVCEGTGWTILTPLHLYSAKVPLGAVTVAPIPAMRFSRQIELIAQEDRLMDLPKRVADFCIRVLEEDIAPALKAYAPFAADRVICGDLRYA